MSIYSNVAMMVMQERREIGRDQIKAGKETVAHAEIQQKLDEHKADKDTLGIIVGLVDDVVSAAISMVGKVGKFQDALKAESAVVPPPDPAAIADPATKPKEEEKEKGDWDPILGQLKKSGYDALSSEKQARAAGEMHGVVGRSEEAAAKEAQAHARTAEDLAQLGEQAARSRTRWF